MTEAEKIQKIEQYRKKLERKLAADFGIDADVSVYLHRSTFDQYAASCSLGWEVRRNIGSIMAVSSPKKTGGSGDTTIFYRPAPVQL